MKYLRCKKTREVYCIVREYSRAIEICDCNGKHRIIRKCVVDKFFYNF